MFYKHHSSFNMSGVLKSALSPASFKCVTSRENLSSGVSFRTDTNRAVHHRRQGIQRSMVLVPSGQFSSTFFKFIFCFLYTIFDLKRDVETMHDLCY